jgi:hypothetical protein
MHDVHWREWVIYILDVKDKHVHNINTKRLQPNDLNPTFI